MSDRREKMTEDDLAGIVGRRVTDAISYDNEQRQDKRIRAINYYNRVMPDTPSGPNRSKVTTSDLADNISWIMPGLMRIFAGAGGIVKYEATRPEEEQHAEQATEYVEWVFWRECAGYVFLWTWFRDALQHGNGVAKAWFQVDKPRVIKEKYDALDVDQIMLLVEDSNVEIIGQEIAGPAPEATDPAASLYNIAIKRTIPRKRLMVEVIPPEEFLIDRNTRAFKDSPLLGHRTRKTRSDLVEMGYDRDVIDELPAYPIQLDQTETTRRGDTMVMVGETGGDASTDMVEYFEVFVCADMDGDGIAELLKVCGGGDANSPTILSWEEWDEELSPYVDLPCEIAPHVWQGRSIADAVMDDQRVNTVLTRGILDNIYLSNMPQRGVDVTRVEDLEEVMDAGPGDVIRTKGDPRAAIADLAIPFVAQHSLAILQWNKTQLQARVGVSRQTPALDGDALVPKTATASAIEADEGYAQVETIARTFAETGIKSLFSLILRLIVKHQDAARTIKIGEDWKTFDPRFWNADMAAEPDVGLGTGTRERDLGMLTRVAGEQDKVIAQLGPINPVVKPSMWIKTRQRMVAAAGLKNPEQYFASVSDEDFAKFIEWKKQNTPPDPKVQQAQAKAETDRMKAEADISLKREKNQADIALKSQEMNLEAQLSVTDMALGHATRGDTNIRGPDSL